MDITLLGVPFDLDQRLSPEADTPARLREAGLAERLAVAGGGDVTWRSVEPDLPGGKPRKRIGVLMRALGEAVYETRLAGRFPLVIGGDCMTSIGVLAGLQRERDDLGVLWFDAHGDFNTHQTTPSGYLGGMPLAMLVGRGDQTIVQAAGIASPVAEDRVVLTDARDLDPGEAEALADSAVRHLPDVEQVLAHPLPDGPLYVHLDVDVLDPAFMPAVQYQTPGGSDLVAFNRILRHVSSGDVATLTLSALDVARDADGRSVEAAIGLLESAVGEMSA